MKKRSEKEKQLEDSILKIRSIKTKRFLKLSIITGIIFVPLKFFIDIKLSVIILTSVLLIEAYLIWKDKIVKEAIIAFMFAMIVTSYYNYEYTTTNIFIGKINLFPLISWTAGLVLTREIYTRINEKYRFFLACIIYWVILLFLEYVFYNFLNVRLNSDYPGLFGLNIMHARTGMKIFYLSAGPIYLIITDYLRIRKK